jgi:hypothetical protein
LCALTKENGTNPAGLYGGMCLQIRCFVGGNSKSIRDALNRSEFEDEADLKSVVAGRTVESATLFFQEELRLSKSNASVLAGRVFQPQVQAPPAPG